MTHNHNSRTQLSITPVLATPPPTRPTRPTRPITTTTATVPTINNNLQFVYLLLHNDVTTGYMLCTLSELMLSYFNL